MTTKATKKPRSATDAYLELLASYGVKFKPNILLNSAVVLAIAIAAAVADGGTLYRTVDAILSGDAVLTFLLTFAGAAVMDLFPAYFPIALSKLKKAKETGDDFDYVKYKALLAIGTVTCIFTLLAVSAMRFGFADFLLADLLEDNAAAQLSGSFYIPVNQYGKYALPLFMNTVNFGTTAGVFVIGCLSQLSQKRQEAILLNELQLKKEQLIRDAQKEEEELQQTVGNTQSRNAYVQSEVDHAREAAAEKAKLALIEAVEQLALHHGDADITRKMLDSLKEMDVRFFENTNAAPTGTDGADYLRGDY